MDDRSTPGSNSKEKALFQATKDRKLRRAIVAQVLRDTVNKRKYLTFWQTIFKDFPERSYLLCKSNSNLQLIMIFIHF